MWKGTDRPNAGKGHERTLSVPKTKEDGKKSPREERESFLYVSFSSFFLFESLETLVAGPVQFDRFDWSAIENAAGFLWGFGTCILDQFKDVSWWDIALQKLSEKSDGQQKKKKENNTT